MKPTPAKGSPFPKPTIDATIKVTTVRTIKVTVEFILFLNYERKSERNSEIL
jgi:hypothetical protein